MRTTRVASGSQRVASPKPRKRTVTGTLTVRRDDDGNAVSAKLVAADGSAYYIVLDHKGQELAEEPEAHRLVVSGHVTDEDGDRLLSVKHSRPIRAAAK